MKYPAITITAGLLLASAQSLSAHEVSGAIKITPYSPGIAMSKSVQAGITPDEAINILKSGNVRFVTGKPLTRTQKNLGNSNCFRSIPLCACYCLYGL